MDLSKAKDAFLQEARELLQQFEDLLLKAESASLNPEDLGAAEGMQAQHGLGSQVLSKLPGDGGGRGQGIKPDRMGMAVSIEARTPFLDWRMMEFAFRSRGVTKLSAQGDKKHWFKRAAVPLIGEDLAYRKKQMFTVPIGEWFRNESYPWLKSLLDGSDVLRAWFEPAVVSSMLERHRDGRENFTRELRALAALALWELQP